MDHEGEVEKWSNHGWKEPTDNRTMTARQREHSGWYRLISTAGLPLRPRYDSGVARSRIVVDRSDPELARWWK